MEPRFAELLAKTSFSFLEGASHPQEVVTAARDLGLAAVAICDRDGFYGSARAHATGKEIGQRFVVGAELTLEPASAGTIALLAVDHDGYSNACDLLTAAHADHEKGTAGISVHHVAAASAGLVAVVPLDVRRAADAPLDAVLGPIRDAFGDRAFIATWRHKDGHDRTRVRAALAA